jgi:heme-degrading monooxygenase HmoA
MAKFASGGHLPQIQMLRPAPQASPLRRCGQTALLLSFGTSKEMPFMYIAMNRFKVAKGSEGEFESLWRNRDRRLTEVPGFVQFHLLKGPEHDDHTLFASHTMWKSHEHFLAWTKSRHFRDAHANAGGTKALYLGYPQFEGFEVVLDR